MTISCSTNLAQSNKGTGERMEWTNSLKDLVRPAGIETAAYGFEGQFSGFS